MASAKKSVNFNDAGPKRHSDGNVDSIGSDKKEENQNREVFAKLKKHVIFQDALSEESEKKAREQKRDEVAEVGVKETDEGDGKKLQLTHEECVAICTDYPFLYTLQEALLPHFTSYSPICNNLAHCPLSVEINVSKSGFQMEQKRHAQLAKILQSPPEELNLETQWLSKMQRSFSIMIVQLDSSAPSEGGLLSRAELTNLVGNLERLRDTLDNTGKASKPLVIVITGEKMGTSKAMNTMQMFRTLSEKDNVRLCPIFTTDTTDTQQANVQVTLQNVFVDVVRRFILPKLKYAAIEAIERQVEIEEQPSPPPSETPSPKKKGRGRKGRGRKGSRGRGKGRGK